MPAPDPLCRCAAAQRHRQYPQAHPAQESFHCLGHRHGRSCLVTRRILPVSFLVPCPTTKKVQDMLSTKNKAISLLAAAAAFTLLATQSAFAQKKYDTGASDSEIKIGNVEAYSGPASAYGVIGKTEEAYFKMINDNGGVNGRKINFISYDDGYSPPKTVEQTRKLIESDEVLLVCNALGTPTQTAVQKYQNNKKMPQLFVSTGASKLDDPKDFPWTMGCY